MVGMTVLFYLVNTGRKNKLFKVSTSSYDFVASLLQIVTQYLTDSEQGFLDGPMECRWQYL